MDNQPCPYLGTLDQQNNQQPCTAFPSFENCCFTEISPGQSPLMLADQATYCLSGSYGLCPRYQSASLRPHSAGATGAAARKTSIDLYALTSEPHATIESDLLHPDAMPFNAPSSGSTAYGGDFNGDFDGEFDGTFDDGEPRSRWGLWMVALTIFLLIFVCGVASSTYAGWQFVRNSGFATLLRADTALSSGVGEMAVAAPSATTASLFVVVTATPLPGSAPSTGADAGVAVNPAEGNAQAALPTNFNFPQAVTPTPRSGEGGIVVVEPAPGNASGAQIAPTLGGATQDVIVVNPVTDPAANPVTNPAADPASQLQPTPLPNIDVNALVPIPPTRRATPEFDIPTSTPVLETPTETPSPTATWLPPVVIFGPDDEWLHGGECTMVRWEVENVSAVYYQNQQALGTGEKEECLPDDENDWQIYALTVVLPSGATEIYTTTVSVYQPTVTPTPSRTYTPIPIPTETWTPVPPTPTPAPNYVYGTTLTSQSGQSAVTCAIGQTCEIGLLATNTGNTDDTIAIVVAQAGPWQPFLCRQDGVCASNGRLELDNVGQSLTAFVTLRIDIPDNTARQTTTYALRSVSVGSGDTVASDTLSIQVEAK